MYWTKPLLGAWVWVLIGEWERNGKNKSLVMAETCMGSCDLGVFRTPAFAKCGVLGRLYLVVTAISQHHFFDSKRSSFRSERFGFVHGRSLKRARCRAHFTGRDAEISCCGRQAAMAEQ